MLQTQRQVTYHAVLCIPGLSEAIVNVDLLHKAHAVHPISAVQLQWSL